MNKTYNNSCNNSSNKILKCHKSNICKICNKLFKTNNELNIHIQICKNIREYEKLIDLMAIKIKKMESTILELQKDKLKLLEEKLEKETLDHKARQHFYDFNKKFNEMVANNRLVDNKILLLEYDKK